MSIHLIKVPVSPGLSVSGTSGAAPAAASAAPPAAASSSPPVSPSRVSGAGVPDAPVNVAKADGLPAASAVSGASEVREPETVRLEAAAQKVQEMLQAKSNNLLFSLDRDSGKTIVKVVDAQTEELVRQFPSEEMLALAASLEEFQELQQGVLLKDKA